MYDDEITDHVVPIKSKWIENDDQEDSDDNSSSKNVEKSKTEIKSSVQLSSSLDSNHLKSKADKLLEKINKTNLLPLKAFEIQKIESKRFESSPDNNDDDGLEERDAKIAFEPQLNFAQMTMPGSNSKYSSKSDSKNPRKSSLSSDTKKESVKVRLYEFKHSIF